MCSGCDWCVECSCCICDVAGKTHLARSLVRFLLTASKKPLRFLFLAAKNLSLDHILLPMLDFLPRQSRSILRLGSRSEHAASFTTEQDAKKTVKVKNQQQLQAVRLGLESRVQELSHLMESTPKIFALMEKFFAPISPQFKRPSIADLKQFQSMLLKIFRCVRFNFFIRVHRCVYSPLLFVMCLQIGTDRQPSRRGLESWTCRRPHRMDASFDQRARFWNSASFCSWRRLGMNTCRHDFETTFVYW